MIIDQLKAYIETFTNAIDETNPPPLWVNYLREQPMEFGIVPLPGAKTVSTNIIGLATKEFPFALQSTQSTADEVARLESIGLFEEFSKWLDDQTEAGELPVLEDGKVATKIEATGWGTLQQQGESQTGIYQITCRLEYEEQE